MRKIKITVGNYLFEAFINDTSTANVIFEHLPINGKAIRWGDEIYFYVDLNISLENDARQDVEIGDLGYWPDGPALCIFFGKTPVSISEKPRAYSPVNIFGKITSNTNDLKKVKNGEFIVFEKDSD